MVNPVDPVSHTPLSYQETNERQPSWLVRTSVHNPYLVIVLCLFIAVIGCWVTPNPWWPDWRWLPEWPANERGIPVDILPAYNTPAVQVLTPGHAGGDRPRRVRRQATAHLRLRRSE